MKRRTLVRGALVACCVGAGVVQSPDASALRALLEGLTGDAESAAWIGERGLREGALPSHMGVLLADRSMAFLGDADPRMATALRAAYRARRAHEFHTGDLVLIGHTALARCEAHLFAVLALLRGVAGA